MNVSRVEIDESLTIERNDSGGYNLEFDPHEEIELEEAVTRVERRIVYLDDKIRTTDSYLRQHAETYTENQKNAFLEERTAARREKEELERFRTWAQELLRKDDRGTSPT